MDELDILTASPSPTRGRTCTSVEVACREDSFTPASSWGERTDPSVYRLTMTEQQPYLTVRTGPDFELRRYPQHVVAEVTVDGDFDSAGNRAFRSLFGYISGDNTANQTLAMTSPVVQSPGGRGSSASQKIEMTAPVVQRTGADAHTHVVAFVLPATLTEDSAPEPANPHVVLRTVPEALVAATTYSGRWTQRAYEDHCAKLLARVTAAGLTTIGEPRFARFDPPLKPWFLRRNEVLVDVEE